MTRDARDVLASHADDHEVVREIQTDDRNHVLEVRLEGIRAVCKIARDDPTGVNRDALVSRRLAERDLPIPAIHATGDGYLITEWCGTAYDGDAPRDVRRRRLRAAGAALARIHRATTFDDHGDLVPAGGGLALESRGPWPEAFLENVRDLRDLLEGGRFESLADDVVAVVEANLEAFAAAGPPALAHGDYEADNLRFERDGVAAVLDWERASAAPGEFDLARAELGWYLKPNSPEVRSDLCDALRAGYESVRPLPAGSAARRDAYRAALTLGPLREIERLADRDAMRTAALEASTTSYVRERLEAARAGLRSAPAVDEPSPEVQR